MVVCFGSVGKAPPPAASLPALSSAFISAGMQKMWEQLRERWGGGRWGRAALNGDGFKRERGQRTGRKEESWQIGMMVVVGC